MPDANDAPSFGSLLRSCRLGAGLTQEALSERSGVAKRTLQDLERGVTRPRRETARRLVSVLRPPPDIRAQFEAATSAPRRHPEREREVRTMENSHRRQGAAPDNDVSDASVLRRRPPIRLTTRQRTWVLQQWPSE